MVAHQGSRTDHGDTWPRNMRVGVKNLQTQLTPLRISDSGKSGAA